MNYEDDFTKWEKTVPPSITCDPLWRMRVYRLALFVCDISWDDVTILSKDSRTRSLSDQLYRSLGSIGANIAEGYSRGSGKDRARFYEYALGSARESRDWYFKGRRPIGDDVAFARMDMLAEIIRQLLVIIGNQPGRTLREPSVDYTPDTDHQN
ncbi:MAG: four helix bundle protein [Bacteroidetes bacterium]|nr:four helix bundle protein [Bacteroidota bacterium]